MVQHKDPNTTRRGVSPGTAEFQMRQELARGGMSWVNEPKAHQPHALPSNASYFPARLPSAAPPPPAEFSVLHFHARRGDLHKTRDSLPKHADQLNAPDRHGHTPVHYAIMAAVEGGRDSYDSYARETNLRELLSHPQAKISDKAFSLAAGNPAVIHLLNSRKLVDAAEQGNGKAAADALAQGADTRFRVGGQTAAERAHISGHASVLKLIETDERHKKEALLTAAGSADAPAMARILSSGGKEFFMSRDHTGKTLIDQARDITRQGEYYSGKLPPGRFSEAGALLDNYQGQVATPPPEPLPIPLHTVAHRTVTVSSAAQPGGIGKWLAPIGGAIAGIAGMVLGNPLLMMIAAAAILYVGYQYIKKSGPFTPAPDSAPPATPGTQPQHEQGQAQQVDPSLAPQPIISPDHHLPTGKPKAPHQPNAPQR